MPNELTPARRGPPLAGQGGERGVDVEAGCAAKSISGLGVSKCRLGGISPCSQGEDRLDQAGDAGGGVQVADVGLDRAERAEALAVAPAPKALRSAATSIGSPSGVPVPWAST